jgi:hypothetical protein
VPRSELTDPKTARPSAAPRVLPPFPWWLQFISVAGPGIVVMLADTDVAASLRRPRAGRFRAEPRTESRPAPTARHYSFSNAAPILWILMDRLGSRTLRRAKDRGPNCSPAYAHSPLDEHRHDCTTTRKLAAFRRCHRISLREMRQSVGDGLNIHDQGEECAAPFGKRPQHAETRFQSPWLRLRIF